MYALFSGVEKRCAVPFLLTRYRGGIVLLRRSVVVQVKCSKGRYRKILKIIHPSVVTTLIANLLKLHSSLYLPPRGPKLFHPQCLNLAKIFINPRFCADRTLDPSLPLLDLFLLLKFQNLVIGSIQNEESSSSINLSLFSCTENYSTAMTRTIGSFPPPHTLRHSNTAKTNESHHSSSHNPPALYPPTQPPHAPSFFYSSDTS
jgi:hypothetical protein